jgi:hypothetical protein
MGFPALAVFSTLACFIALRLDKIPNLLTDKIDNDLRYSGGKNIKWYGLTYMQKYIALSERAAYLSVINGY